MAITVQRTRLDPGELRVELKEFESRYGHTSERMDLAFTNPEGVFTETPEWRQWDRAYALWLYLQQT